MKEILHGIGERLRKFRKKILDITQQEMANESEVQRSQIGAVEAGMQAPSFDLVFKISAKYGLSLDWLIFDVGDVYRFDRNHWINQLEPEFKEVIKQSITLSAKDRRAMVALLKTHIANVLDNNSGE